MSLVNAQFRLSSFWTILWPPLTALLTVWRTTVCLNQTVFNSNGVGLTGNLIRLSQMAHLTLVKIPQSESSCTTY